jgi:hypothetical protein
VAQGQRGRHGRVHGSQLRRSSQPSWATTWPEGMKQALAYYRAASPQLEATIDDIFAAGDRVALRWSARGTHLGEWLEGPDWAPLYDERDHHLPDRRRQGGGRLEQHRGEPHGGRTAVVYRRR